MLHLLFSDDVIRDFTLRNLNALPKKREVEERERERDEEETEEKQERLEREDTERRP
jgi:hypothetical protein